MKYLYPLLKYITENNTPEEAVGEFKIHVLEVSHSD